MRTSTLRSQLFFLPRFTSSNPTIPIRTKSYPKPPLYGCTSSHAPSRLTAIFTRRAEENPAARTSHEDKLLTLESNEREFLEVFADGDSRVLVVGAISLGFVLLFMGMDEHNKALALGPEGPLVEEFWENVRRYALYALTVSTGALYTIFQPIFELLRNPISAILLLVILGGSVYIVSQVLSAMVGITEFAYDYGY